MNLVEFHQAITSHLSGWNPTLLVGDNLPARTSNEKEYIRLTVLEGLGFVDESVGVYSVNGSTVLHAFILQFDVYTELNADTNRSALLCQEVLDHWQVRDFGNGVNTLAGSVQRIGEAKPRYHAIVSIEGRREETLAKR